MKTHFAIALLAGTLLGGPLAAQRTWIVDALNRPGTDFTDLPFALSRANDGDTIRVRGGTYSSGQTAKALTILGDPGAWVNCVRRNPDQVVPFRVSGLAAGKTLVLRGLRFRYNAFARPAPILEVTDNGGHVHLEDCTVDGVFSLHSYFRFPLEQSAWIFRSARVSMTRCRVIGSTRISGCTVQATACTFAGREAGRTDPSSGNYVGSSTGIRCRDSTLLLSQCNVSGGSGATVGHHILSASVGMSSILSDLVIAGDSRSSVVAGTDSQPQDAVFAIGGNFLYDVRVGLEPTGNGKPHRGFTNAWGTRVPSLTASAFRVGATGSVVLQSQDRHLFAAMFGSPDDPVSIGSLGQLWLQPASLLVFTTGQQGRTEHETIALPIPNDLALRGRTLGFQCLSEATDPSTRRRAWKLSTPAIVAID